MYLVGLLFLTLYLLPKYRYQKTTSIILSGTDSEFPHEEVGPKKLFDTHLILPRRMLFLLLTMALFATYNLGEIGHLTFQNTFFQSLNEVNITAGEAAKISSISATSYTGM